MNEALITSFIFLILLGAMGFYFYARMLYTEKKVGLLESILLDIKMSMELEQEEREQFAAAGTGLPLKATSVAATAAAATVVESPEPLQGADSEELKEDTAFYSSVLESAQEQVAEFLPTTTRPPTDEEANYDALSREELMALAEKSGIRVTKRMTRGTIVALLRDATKKASGEPGSGSEDGVAPAPLDGASDGAPLDLGGVEATPLESN